MTIAPFADPVVNGVANGPHLLQNLLRRSRESRGIGEAPVLALSVAGNDRATFGTGLVADGDDIIVPAFHDAEIVDAFGRILRDVDSDLAHCFNHDRIQAARL